MMRSVRDLRLIPIALIASACLLALKTADLILSGSDFFTGNRAASYGDVAVVRPAGDATQPAGAALSWAQQMFNFPTGSGAAPAGGMAPVSTPAERAKADRAAAQANADITGAIANPPPAGAAKAAPGAPGPANGKPASIPVVDGIVIPTDGVALPSGAEREILERLRQRREQLDTRARELDIRENLVKAAEQRIDAHLAEVKEVEARIKTETMQKDQAEVTRFKSLVTMYENMKSRDAAKIFNGLDMDVLIKVVSQINPRSMADIMAQMTPDIAERLTVALASKAQATAKNDPTQLPKIEGQPTMP